MTSRHRILLPTLLLLAIGSVSAGEVQAQADSELLGGWIITGWEWPAGRTGPTPQRGLFIFSESGHYSMMFIIGDERPALGTDPSDSDVAAAYGPLVANSGRYSTSGSELTYEAFVAKDPAYMSDFAPTGGAGNAQTVTWEVADGTLTLRFGADAGLMGGSVATLRRPGGNE